MTDTKTTTWPIESHTDLTLSDGTVVNVAARSDAQTAGLMVTSPTDQSSMLTRDDLDQLIDALRSAHGLVMAARIAARERGEL